MEFNKDIHTAMTIAQRYAVLNLAANKASEALTFMQFQLFGDSLTEFEKADLRKADKIINKIRSNTSNHDAIDYFKKLTPED